MIKAGWQPRRCRQRLWHPIIISHGNGYTTLYAHCLSLVVHAGQSVPISVMGSGWNIIGIYSYELYKFYDVDNIIRIGSAGSYTDKAKLFDVVLAAGAVSESNYARVQSGFEGGDLTLPSQTLNDKLRYRYCRRAAATSGTGRPRPGVAFEFGNREPERHYGKDPEDFIWER